MLQKEIHILSIYCYFSQLLRIYAEGLRLNKAARSHEVIRSMNLTLRKGPEELYQ